MLASLFFMQPVGQLLGNLVAVIAISSLKARIDGSGPGKCTDDCKQTMDQMWRWVVGFGAIPPALGLVLRLYIPESTRYMFDVAKGRIRGTQTTHAYSISAMDEGAQTDNEATSTNQVQNKNPQDLYPLQREDNLQLSEQQQKERQVEKVTWNEYYTGLRQYLFEEGYIRDLIGTSGAWFLLDLCFCFLGISNPRIVALVSAKVKTTTTTKMCTHIS